jgi:hypothetical protein
LSATGAPLIDNQYLDTKRSLPCPTKLDLSQSHQKRNKSALRARSNYLRGSFHDAASVEIEAARLPC